MSIAEVTVAIRDYQERDIDLSDLSEKERKKFYNELAHLGFEVKSELDGNRLTIIRVLDPSGAVK